MSGIREQRILRSQPKLSNIRSYGPRQPRAVIVFTAEDVSASSAARKFSYSDITETAIGALRSQARAKRSATLLLTWIRFPVVCLTRAGSKRLKPYWEFTR
jgi:hypothetical protein